MVLHEGDALQREESFNLAIVRGTCRTEIVGHPRSVGENQLALRDFAVEGAERVDPGAVSALAA